MMGVIGMMGMGGVIGVSWRLSLSKLVGWLVFGFLNLANFIIILLILKSFNSNLDKKIVPLDLAKKNHANHLNCSICVSDKTTKSHKYLF